MNFKRNISAQLVKWKNSKNRKPLILKGARQVGKTWLLKDFGKKAFDNNIAYFNFDEQPELSQFFQHSKDVKRIIQNLSIVNGSAIKPQKTLIVFDEIQECLPALNSLKYFCENAPEYHIASAGSLLGIALGNKSSFPVGKVEFMDVYPLTFSEFLNGLDASLSKYLESIKEIEAIPDLFFNALIEKFKMYFISGGLPEAAQKLVFENDIALTEKVLTNILNSYALDFTKHTSAKDYPKISSVWESIPSQLSRENKKFLYQLVKTGARARDYEDALKWLTSSGLICKIYHCKKPGLPLSAYDDLSAFKIYLLDVGLLRRHSRLDTYAFKEGNRLFVEFKGALTENYILQSLLPQFDVIPRYWTSEGKAEVDFLIQYKNEIIPVEVKSDENVRSKSLTYYSNTFKPNLRIRFSMKNLNINDGLLNIPLFMADYAKKLIAKI